MRTTTRSCRLATRAVPVFLLAGALIGTGAGAGAAYAAPSHPTVRMQCNNDPHYNPSRDPIHCPTRDHYGDRDGYNDDDGGRYRDHGDGWDHDGDGWGHYGDHDGGWHHRY